MTGVTRGLLRIIVDGKIKKLVRTEVNGDRHYIKVRSNGKVRRVYQTEFRQLAKRTYGENVKLEYR